MRALLIATLLFQETLGWYYGRPDPGSSTQGGVWPLPWTISYDTYNHTVNPGQFHFVSKIGSCDVIDKAMSRYEKLAFPLYDPSSYNDSPATLTTLSISVAKGCTSGYPQFDMDESYNINVDRSKGIATLTANEVWGALRGLETFSQLVFQPKKNQYRVRAATVADSPRFPHRGVMIDSARHFLPVGALLQNLDLMAQNKMNVLHWHLVDSESFPYTSVVFANLSQLGAYTPAHIYSTDDIRKVLDYARLRGIRVIPEFDTPGHFGAWGKAMPHLLPTCYNSQGFISELSNILDPTLDDTYNFLASFFTEALTLFKDNYMHFGGDEVASDMQQCWANNAEVTKRMKAMGFSSTSQLLDYYWKKLFSIIDKARIGTAKVVWQEVLDMSVPANTSIAHVWKGGSIDEIMNEMASVTANGHRAILSSCWYLNYIKYGADWGYVDNSNMRLRGLYYECDPTNFQGTAAQKALVLGGEAAMWGEFVDATNLIQRLWGVSAVFPTGLEAIGLHLSYRRLAKPRASAVAERLWSDPSATFSADAAWPRLHEFRCRMTNRGFPTEPPNNPDYCPFEWNPNYTEL
ncbi:unnamed protein product [Cylicocyclus nassatus]|uniref:Beta-hexosaminidase n=1 Tax=Cylicocyclus nassatus TaxID=53992 RepID=A0AA36GGQ0_CYLNA|nr:unnamed protein product [Cylicocyclus nassatus]